MSGTPRRRPSLRLVLGAVFVVSLVLAGLVSRFADSAPDGLQRTAEKLGFASTETAHHASGSPFAGYQGPFAGIVGVLVVLAIAGGLTWLLRRAGRPSAEAAANEEPRSSDRSA